MSSRCPKANRNRQGLSPTQTKYNTYILSVPTFRSSVI
nr:MAG TPA: hypothetical protein [Caudoviricetes sp.]